ncbi:unnamed protein product [Caenorhabditis brenneri]
MPFLLLSQASSQFFFAQVQENNEDDDKESFGSKSPRASPSSSTASIPTGQVQENNEDDDEESFGSESPRASPSSSAALIPTGSVSPNAENLLISDHEYLHQIEHKIAARQTNDVVYDDLYDGTTRNHRTGKVEVAISEPGMKIQDALRRGESSWNSRSFGVRRAVQCSEHSSHHSSTRLNQAPHRGTLLPSQRKQPDQWITSDFHSANQVHVPASPSYE